MGNTFGSAAPNPVPVPKLQDEDVWLTPVDLTRVSLTRGSRLYASLQLNVQYLLSLDVDRLLYSFRVVAGVDTRGAQPYGGWEAPSYPPHGHFVGHALMSYAWLSQTLAAEQPDTAAECKRRSDAMVAGYAECQNAQPRTSAVKSSSGRSESDAWGYFGSQGTDTFDRLEALADEDLQDCPYYLVHKNIAGLLAAHRYTANALALPTASGLADYFVWRHSRLTQHTIDAMINTKRYTGQYTAFFMEHGGILDGMIELYKLTQKPEHLELLRHFDRAWFRDMLVSGDDQLADNAEHANTELQPVTGLANMFLFTKDVRYRTATLNFLSWMQAGHEFINGNVSGKSAFPAPVDYGSELFNSPQLLDRQVNSTPGHPGHGSSESCCAHNLQKTTLHAISFTGDCRWADEFEKRFVNCVMAQQHPTTGMFIYNLNLQQGARKVYGDAENSFWCCYGSGIEAYSSLTNGAFLTDGQNGLWISNFIASTMSWPEQGLTLQLDTAFPDNGSVKLGFSLKQPCRLVVHIRIPYWAVGAVSLRLNGTEQQVAKAPGTFAVLDRDWTSGDVVELDLPFSLYPEPIPDKLSYVGVKYGPHALVACAASGSTFDGTAAQLIAALTPTAGVPCTFTATLQGPVTPRTVTFRPLWQVTDDCYNGYTIVTKPPAETLLDFVDIGDAASEQAHALLFDSSQTGSNKSLQWRNATDNGFLSYKLAVHPTKRTYLKALYDGDEASDERSSRVFDIQVQRADGSFRTIATQSLDAEAPQQWYVVVYPIPPQLTQGMTTLRFRFQAKGFDTKPSNAGALYDQLRTHVYADA